MFWHVSISFLSSKPSLKIVSEMMHFCVEWTLNHIQSITVAHGIWRTFVITERISMHLGLPPYRPAFGTKWGDQNVSSPAENTSSQSRSNGSADHSPVLSATRSHSRRRIFLCLLIRRTESQTYSIDHRQRILRERRNIRSATWLCSSWSHIFTQWIHFWRSGHCI